MRERFPAVLTPATDILPIGSAMAPAVAGGNGILSADIDSDSNVSLQEMYSYTYENVKEMVAAEDGIDDVQVYPANDSSFNVFSRTGGDAGERLYPNRPE